MFIVLQCKLDPLHYFTSHAGLSWDAMLKMTDIKLELMTDIDMFQLIKKGMHAGISYIANIIDMEKQIINKCLIVIAANHQSIYNYYVSGWQ